MKLFQYPGLHDPCILVRLGADKYVAYSQKCTHLSCAVYYERERTVWSALATRAIFRSERERSCRGRRRVRCRVFNWKGEAINS